MCTGVHIHRHGLNLQGDPTYRSVSRGLPENTEEQAQTEGTLNANLGVAG